MLIFGHWGAPELGAEGCGCGYCRFNVDQYRYHRDIYADLKDTKTLPTREMATDPPTESAITEILIVGIPVGLTFFLESGCFLCESHCSSRPLVMSLLPHIRSRSISGMFSIFQ